MTGKEINMKAGILKMILIGMIMIPPGLCKTENKASGTEATRGIPERITRPLTLQKVIRITTGKNSTNAVPSASEAGGAQQEIPVLTNKTPRSAETPEKTRRTRGESSTRFIDIDGDGIADDRDL
jgi:hypothetical protein